MVLDKITKIAKAEGFEIFYAYEQNYPGSIQQKYIIHFNNFMMSLIIAEQKFDASYKYDFALLKSTSDMNSEFEFFNSDDTPIGMRIYESDESMMKAFHDLVETDKQMGLNQEVK